MSLRSRIWLRRVLKACFGAHRKGDWSNLDLEAGSRRQTAKLVRYCDDLASLARPFFFALQSRCRAVFLSIALFLLLLSESFAMVYHSTVQKHYMTALQSKDEKGFYSGLWSVFGIIIVILPIIGLHTWVHSRLVMEWRVALTRHFARTYIVGPEERDRSLGAFYALSLGGNVDNPDQRICQDVNDFVTTCVKLASDSIGSLLKLCGFATVLYGISPTVCAIVITYAVVGTLVSYLGFGPPIMRVKQACLKQEAELRYCLIRLRENAESIAFFRGGGVEWCRFVTLFASLTDTISQGILLRSSFKTFTTGFNYATFAVPALLIGPAYLRGETEFGAIAQCSFAFHVILGALSLLITHLEDVSTFAVQIDRLRTLDRELDVSCKGSGQITMIETDENVPFLLKLNDLTLYTPHCRGSAAQMLVSGASLQLLRGESLLITGASGIGKSSLLRMVAGLWSSGHGSVHCPCSKSSFFMPQRPYMCVGTLREQLLYPQVPRGTCPDEDAALHQTISDVRLEYLLQRHRLDETEDWARLLSLGEQQRLGFARVLLQPAGSMQVAIVDEGTSACDPANESHLYELLSGRLNSFISVGHRPSLRQYHTHALWMQRNEAGNASGHASVAFLSMSDYEKLAF